MDAGPVGQLQQVSVPPQLGWQFAMRSEVRLRLLWCFAAGARKMQSM